MILQALLAWICKERSLEKRAKSFEQHQEFVQPKKILFKSELLQVHNYKQYQKFVQPKKVCSSLT